MDINSIMGKKKVRIADPMHFLSSLLSAVVTKIGFHLKGVYPF